MMKLMVLLGVVVVATANSPPTTHHTEHVNPLRSTSPTSLLRARAHGARLRREHHKPWCLEDAEYPLYEIKHAVNYHFTKVIDLYADVADLSTENSVERPKTLEEETYLCSSVTAYVRPLRAINTDGKWRIVVNNVDTHYKTLTQTTRVEECLTAGDACPLVPECHASSCLQKSIYHRFLVFDPYDQYFPFAVETFKLPASCACLLGASTLDH